MRLKINLENISDKSIVNEGSRRIFKNQTKTNKKKLSTEIIEHCI